MVKEVLEYKQAATKTDQLANQVEQYKSQLAAFQTSTGQAQLQIGRTELKKQQLTKQIEQAEKYCVLTYSP